MTFAEKYDILIMEGGFMFEDGNNDKNIENQQEIQEFNENLKSKENNIIIFQNMNISKSIENMPYIFCKKCGNKVIADSNFCSNCGYQVSK